MREKKQPPTTAYLVRGDLTLSAPPTPICARRLRVICARAGVRRGSAVRAVAEGEEGGDEGRGRPGQHGRGGCFPIRPTGRLTGCFWATRVNGVRLRESEDARVCAQRACKGKSSRVLRCCCALLMGGYLYIFRMYVQCWPSPVVF